MEDGLQRYDALLVVSFGGPEGMYGAFPFLENVLRGRNVLRERMLQVAHHYELFGGASPLNQQNRELIAALQKELEEHGPRLPIYWGNRNWHPLLPEAIRQMAVGWYSERTRFCDGGLQFVFQLPPVPSEHQRRTRPRLGQLHRESRNSGLFTTIHYLSKLIWITFAKQ